MALPVKYPILNLAFNKRGFTLLELVIAISIFSLIIFIVTAVLLDVFLGSKQQFLAIDNIDNAKLVSSRFVSELRNAKVGADGSYQITTASDNQIIFYSKSPTGAGTINRIRYFRSGTNLWKGVVTPSESPQIYNLGSEITVIVQKDVVNGENPVFTYYDGNYNSISNALEQPVNLNSIKFVKINLTVLNRVKIGGDSATLPPEIPAGLVRYWKFDEGSGTSATDSSGNGGTGTLMNSPAYSFVIPPVGFSNTHSLSFDGVDDYVTTNSSGAVTSGFISLGGWIKTSAVASQRIISKDDVNANRDFTIMVSSIGKFQVMMWGQKGIISNLDAGVKNIADGQWHHVFATWDGSIIRAYVDGQQDQALPGLSPAGLDTVRNTLVNLEVGRAQTATGTDYFNGNLDDLRIYNYALSPSEVADLYAAEPPPSNQSDPAFTITAGAAIRSLKDNLGN